MKVILEDIKIPYYYSPPKQSKYLKKLNAYLSGEPIDPVLVDDNLTIVDGYMSYLIYKETGAIVIDAYNKKEFPVVYINGSHLHSDKVYTWVVPYKFKRQFINNVKVGDVVMCRSKGKIVPVTVREIYTGNIKDEKYSSVVTF